MPNIQEVRDKIVKYISDSVVPFSNWYVGIASDPRTRLFIEHNVEKNLSGFSKTLVQKKSPAPLKNL